MAAGDITVKIRPDGAFAVVTVEGAAYATGATYDFDLRGAIRGSVAGTFVSNELMTQAVTGATARFVSVSQDTAGHLVVVQDLTGSPNNSNVWNAPSTAVLTPTDAPTMTLPGPATPYLNVPSYKYTGTSQGTGVRQVYLTDPGRFPAGASTATGSFSIAGAFTSGTFTDGEIITQRVTGCTAIIIGDQGAGPLLYAKILTSAGSVNTNIWDGAGGGVFTPLGTPNLIVFPTRDEKDPGTGLDFLVSLSQYVYDPEDSGGIGSNITLTCPAAFVTSGANTSNARTNAAVVTNGSTQPYQPSMCAWADVPYQRFDSDFYLEVSAWNGQTGNVAIGKPGIECVVVTVTDGTTPQSIQVNWASISPNPGDKCKVQVFRAGPFNNSAFTQGAALTANFVAYPMWGDSNSVFNSATTSVTPADAYGPRTHLCDKNGTYGITYAIVSSSGSDPGGVTVGDDAGKNVGNGATPSGSASNDYATIARAARAIRNYNNANRSRDNVGGGIVYVRGGNYNWLGASISGGYGATPQTWITVKAFPGLQNNEVVINGSSGNSDISDMIKVEGITMASNTTNTFTGINRFWLDSSVINSTSGSPFNDVGINGFYLTNSYLQALNQIFAPTGTSAYPLYILMRGNTFRGYGNNFQGYTVLGNKMEQNQTPGPTFADRKNTGSAAPRGTPIFAFNKILGFNGGGSGLMFNFAALNENHDGMVLAFNVFEMLNNNTQGLGSTGSTAGITAARTRKNFILWNNAFVGQRVFMAYNDNGDIPILYPHWSRKNCCSDITGEKSDSFTGGTGPPAGANAMRIGNWPVQWGVNFTGNIVFNVSAIATPQFDSEFAGIHCDDDGTQHTAAFSGYVDRKAYSGSGTTLGQGTYRFSKSAVTTGGAIEWMLPFDLDAQPVWEPHVGPFKTRNNEVLGTGGVTRVGSTLTSVVSP